MSAVFEGDLPVSVAAKKLTPTRPAGLSNERVKEIRDAQVSLETGLKVMRLICGMFDTEGSLSFTTETVDMHAGLGLAIGHIKKASSLLFNHWGTAREQEQQAFLDVLWDSADIVFCVEAVLQHEELPHGGSMTVCPVRGALTIAISMLEGLVSDISAFLKLNHKRGKRVAEVQHV